MPNISILSKKHFKRNFRSLGQRQEKLSEILKNEFLQTKLSEIQENYVDLFVIIENCKIQDLSIEQAYQIYNIIDFKSDPANIKFYIDSRFKSNEIHKIYENLKDDENKQLFELLKKCPSTSILVERSFSVLNKMLSKDRNFISDNFIKYLKLKINK